MKFSRVGIVALLLAVVASGCITQINLDNRRPAEVEEKKEKRRSRERIRLELLSPKDSGGGVCLAR